MSDYYSLRSWLWCSARRFGAEKTKGRVLFGRKTVDVTATSVFGPEHEIANVDCIVAGLRDGLEGAHIIAPAEFWKTVGGDKETLGLTSFFDERDAHGAKSDDLDFMVVVYHQRIDAESFFAEMYIEGGFRDLDKVIATAVAIDMKKQRKPQELRWLRQK